MKVEMKHEDGFCDGCGAELWDDPPQLTVDGDAVCAECVANGRLKREARRPEARDDGR